MGCEVSQSGMVLGEEKEGAEFSEGGSGWWLSGVGIKLRGACKRRQQRAPRRSHTPTPHALLLHTNLGRKPTTTNERETRLHPSTDRPTGECAAYCYILLMSTSCSPTAKLTDHPAGISRQTTAPLKKEPTQPCVAAQSNFKTTGESAYIVWSTIQYLP